MERKQVFWIEPDDDDFELFVDRIDYLQLDLDLIRFRTIKEAFERLKMLAPVEYPRFVVTEYYRLWVNELGTLHEILVQVPDRLVPVIIFTGNQNPKIADDLPLVKIVQKPFHYKEIDIVIPQIVDLANRIAPD
jgi:hypothetical protein